MKKISFLTSSSIFGDSTQTADIYEPADINPIKNEIVTLGDKIEKLHDLAEKRDVKYTKANAQYTKAIEGLNSRIDQLECKVDNLANTIDERSIKSSKELQELQQENARLSQQCEELRKQQAQLLRNYQQMFSSFRQGFAQQCREDLKQYFITLSECAKKITEDSATIQSTQGQISQQLDSATALASFFCDRAKEEIQDGEMALEKKKARVDALLQLLQQNK